MFDELHEECGVFAISGNPEAANLAYLGLYALQHRGQESAGIASSDGRIIHTHRGMGHVADLFTPEVLGGLPGEMAIGHTRYATAGDGGLAVALAECCAEGTGASISLDTELRPEFALFHEAPSRILISTASPEAVEKIAHDNNIECLRLGVTMKEKLQISNGSTTTAAPWIDCRVEVLREVWENALESLLNPVPV